MHQSQVLVTCLACPEPKLLLSLLSILIIKIKHVLSSQPSHITGGNNWHITQFIIMHEMLMCNIMLVRALKWFNIISYKNTGFYHKTLLGKEKASLIFFSEFHNYSVGQPSFSPSHDNNSNLGRNWSNVKFVQKKNMATTTETPFDGEIHF